jgi:Fe-S oxidoreductase
VGCLHIRPLISLHDPAERAAMVTIAQEATDLVKRFGGALSGEHGDGRARSALLERFYGKPICDGFRAIKSIFDPRNLCNPGNIVKPQPITTALRIQPLEQEVRVPPVTTFFRYDHGFADAVERCNGAGVCRKRTGGTMCPSYRALLDERHATRGRANALRLAITGQLSLGGRSPAWNDTGTIETLDLCLSCKACKAECPSNVDVAKLKAEYTQQRYAQLGRSPWRERLFGNVRLINRAGSALWPVANAMVGFTPTAAVLKRLMGVHPRRSLPRFGRSLRRWCAGRGAVNATGPVVVLLPDCFSVYSEPHVGRAAVTVLERLGYRVVVPESGCCGRAMISQGLVAEATRTCASTARSLLAVVEEHDAVMMVGLEPSCVSAIRDEWLELDLGLDSEVIQRLADRTMLVEAFIESAWERHPARPDWHAPDGTFLLHGHCHQKALWGIESSSALLERLLGDRLTVLDSGCCGMAGAFGYDRSRYDLSVTIAEQSLATTIREHPHATILAPGTSCRHQIADTTARRAIHPIELLAAHHS